MYCENEIYFYRKRVFPHFFCSFCNTTHVLNVQLGRCPGECAKSRFARGCVLRRNQNTYPFFYEYKTYMNCMKNRFGQLPRSVNKPISNMFNIRMDHNRKL